MANMARDLLPEVDRHLIGRGGGGGGGPYLRKKACLAMARCLTKCPEMIDDFVDRVVGLLNDRTHRVLITGLQLMTCVLVTDMEYHGEGGGGGEGGDNTATAAVVATTTTAATTALQRHRTTVVDCAIQISASDNMRSSSFIIL
jgi:hypothetical protein